MKLTVAPFDLIAKLFSNENACGFAWIKKFYLTFLWKNKKNFYERAKQIIHSFHNL